MVGLTPMARQGSGSAASAGNPAPVAGARRVGAALRRAREERGLTLEEVERTIRFTSRQVLAVEEGRTGDLPPQPYARGLVVAYAAFLGLDAEAAAQEWGRASWEGGDERRSLFRAPVRARSNWRDWAVPAACACATAVFVLLGTVFRPTPAELPEPPPARRVEQLPEPAPAPEDADEPRQVAAAGLDLGVLLRSEGSTWVEVSADGEEPRRQQLGPGQSLEVQAHKRLGLALGDAGAVRITVNGRELGFIGDRGETRRGIVFEAPAKRAAPKSTGNDD